MNARAGLLLALALLFAPTAARADEVQLKGGGTIVNVRVTREGEYYRLKRAEGSSLIPADEIAKITYCATLGDTLAEKKLSAGEDPAALRDVAKWAGANGFKDERDHLLALARGIELDRKLAALEGTDKAAPYVDLARSMKQDGYSEVERRTVLDRALALEPSNADARFERGEVQREGRWVTIAQAKQIDDEREARMMEARGFVRFDGRWVTPEAKEDLLARRAAAAAAEDARRALDAERAAARREQEALKAELARLEAERAEQDEAARQARIDAEARAAADRQAAADALARMQAERDALEYERSRRVVVVTGPCAPVVYGSCGPRTVYQPRPVCEPRTVYQPRTVCEPRPVYQPIARPQPCPTPAPARSTYASNPNLNYHPTWRQTGVPTTTSTTSNGQVTVVVTTRRR